MTLRRGTRIRQTSRKKLAPESETADAGALTDSGHTAEIEGRAYDIYLSRNSAPGDPVADWLQAEWELRGAKAPGRS
jgi:hypothetical protein